MSDQTIPKEFWERADQIISLANKQMKDSTLGKVSSSLLYAAARFNSFNVASSAEDIEEMRRDKDDAIEYFTGQYKKMLTENLDDYLENYESYTSNE